jgi:hypothetical protein
MRGMNIPTVRTITMITGDVSPALGTVDSKVISLSSCACVFIFFVETFSGLGDDSSNFLFAEERVGYEFP